MVVPRRQGQRSAVVIALGNRCRGDDGVGLCVAAELKCLNDDYRVIEGRDDAMAIIDAWADAALAIIIDAAISGESPGRVRRVEVGAKPLPKRLARCSSHGIGLAEAVELARVLDKLPGRLVIYAVEAKTFQVGTGLSPEVEAAIGKVAREIEMEIAAFAGA